MILSTQFKKIQRDDSAGVWSIESSLKTRMVPTFTTVPLPRRTIEVVVVAVAVVTLTVVTLVTHLVLLAVVVAVVMVVMDTKTTIVLQVDTTKVRTMEEEGVATSSGVEGTSRGVVEGTTGLEEVLHDPHGEIQGTRKCIQGPVGVSVIFIRTRDLQSKKSVWRCDGIW